MTLKFKVCLLSPLVVAVVMLLYVPIKTAVEYGKYDAVQLTEVKSKVKYVGPVPGNATDDLLVVLHVSDIHVSRFTPKYEQHLKSFVNEIVPAVNPAFVLATGDLTDGYNNPLLFGGEQQLEEWVKYRKILNESGMLSEPNFWLDMRGNHDTYGSGDIENIETNLYEQYGINSATEQGRAHKRAWKRDVSVGGSTFRFVGLDASMGPGVMKPFNYFGHLDSEARQAVLDYINKNSSDVTMNILAGHHPQSQVWGGFGSEINDKCAYYVCGHLHVPDMRMRKSNMIELEVDDLKNSGGFRVMAIDHGVLTFSEEYLSNGFPMGVITNPKDARFLSTNEPSHADESTHVRILAFPDTKSTIQSVRVHFDNDESHDLAGTATFIGENMYALEWSPLKYFATGLHDVHVVITDSNGKVRRIDQQFSLDGTTGTVGVTRYQVEQAVGDTTMVFRVVVAGLIATNMLILIIHRKSLLPGIFGDENTPDSKLAKVFSWYLLISIVVASFGPFMIGFFIKDGEGPLCFVFPWGIAVPGQGFAFDGMAVVFACIVHGGVIFPFLAFLNLHYGESPVAEILALPFERKYLKLRLSCPDTKKAKLITLLRNFFRFYNLFMLIIGPVVMGYQFLGQILPLFISPGILILYSNFAWVLRLSGTSWASKDCKGSVKSDDLEIANSTY